MFRKTKHYVLATPLECLLINEHRMVSGVLVNVSLHGAFVATESGCPVHLKRGQAVWLSTRLDEPRKPVLTFASDRGALVLSNTVRRSTPDPILEIQTCVAWCNYGPQRPVTDLAEGLGLQFLLGERALDSLTAMLSELHYRDLVKSDASWLSDTPESRGERNQAKYFL